MYFWCSGDYGTASSATELSPQLSVQLLTVMESYVFGVAVIVGTGSSSLCLVCSAAKNNL